jgi:hypothetical protein
MLEDVAVLWEAVRRKVLGQTTDSVLPKVAFACAIAFRQQVDHSFEVSRANFSTAKT